MICCTNLISFNYINDTYFCCICSNFFMIPLNMVSVERSMSNLMSNTNNSEARLIALLCFVI